MIRRLLLIVCLCFCVACERQATPEQLDNAKDALASHHWDDAERLLEGYLRRNPDGDNRWDAWIMLLQLSYEIRNDTATTIRLLESMLLEFIHDAKRAEYISLQLAELYESMGDHEKALKTYNYLIDNVELSTESYGEITRRIARLLLLQREFDKAEAVLERYLDLPDIPVKRHAIALYDLAMISMLRDETEKAEALAKRVQQLQGASVALQGQAGFLLADILEQRGEYEAAYDAFEAILFSYPNRGVIERRLELLQERLARE